MKKLICFFAFSFFFFIANNLIAQDINQDIIYLKNGSVIKGKIIEQTPNINLKLKTNDGNIFVYEIKDIEKITKEYIGLIKEDDKSIKKINLIQTEATSYRDPTISSALSFFIPGAGQLYNGQRNKGLGIMLWWVGSGIISLYSYSNANDNPLDQNYNTMLLISSISTISVVMSWVVGLFDAPISSNKINDQYGFTSIQLGEKTNLSFNPDIKLVNNYSSFNSNSLSPSYGLNIKLSF